MARLVFVIPAERADAQLVVGPGGLESVRYGFQIPESSEQGEQLKTKAGIRGIDSIGLCNVFV